MNPVAWMVEKDDDVTFIMNGKGLTKPDGSWDKVTPVYALKELTNDDISAIAKDMFQDYKNFHQYQLDFARAVLQKASEK